MPKIIPKRQGVVKALRDVPTETTATILPMTVGQVGQEALEDARPVKVDSLADAFKKFQPRIDFRTNVGDEGTEFVAELEFNSLKDFDPKQIRTRAPGKRNDIADLQSEIDLLQRMRERFTLLGVKRAWENEEQRREILDAVDDLQQSMRQIAEGEQ